jgi:hypothetical protein
MDLMKLALEKNADVIHEYQIDRTIQKMIENKLSLVYACNKLGEMGIKIINLFKEDPYHYYFKVENCAVKVTEKLSELNFQYVSEIYLTNDHNFIIINNNDDIFFSFVNDSFCKKIREILQIN